MHTSFILTVNNNEYFKCAIFYVVNEGKAGPYTNTAADCNSDLYGFGKQLK